MRMESGKEESRRQRLWTRSEYERLVELGILRHDERVELLEGEILVMSPQGTSHATASVVAREALAPLFGSGVFFREHSPIALDDVSEPEPDLAFVRGNPRDFAVRHPAPPDLLLVVEASDSSWAYDLGRKARAYGRAGVSEYWVLDLVNRLVIVHRDPSGDGYRSVTRHGPGEMLAPRAAASPDTLVDAAALLP